MRMSWTRVRMRGRRRLSGRVRLRAMAALAGLAAAGLGASLAGAGSAAASAVEPASTARAASTASAASTARAASTASAARAALPDPVAVSRLPGVRDAGPAGRRVEVSARLYLAGRDPAAEARFATAVSTPGSGMYGRFLSPARFAARFGPTRAQVAAVTGWARSAGLRVTGVNEHYVAVRGAAPAVGAALGTRLDAYRAA